MPAPKSGQDEELDIQVSVPNNLDSTSVSIYTFHVDLSTLVRYVMSHSKIICVLAHQIE